jgi:hypothetical protein
MMPGSENQVTEEKPAQCHSVQTTAQCHSVQTTVLLAYLLFCVGYVPFRILKISCF